VYEWAWLEMAVVGYMLGRVLRLETDRIACPGSSAGWSDPAAEIVYVPADQVLSFAERDGASSFDARGPATRHGERGGPRL